MIQTGRVLEMYVRILCMYGICVRFVYGIYVRVCEYVQNLCLVHILEWLELGQATKWLEVLVGVATKRMNGTRNRCPFRKVNKTKRSSDGGWFDFDFD